jgi:DNA polymerase III epsilon subunit-like protein
MNWNHPAAPSIHVIDFEGGTYGIIEYGIVTLRQGRVHACQGRLCRAAGDIPTRDTWKHGLRRQDTEHAMPIADDWSLFNALRQDGLFAAHHAPVESRLLKEVWPYPSEAPLFTHPEQRRADWGPWIDTHRIYREVYPSLSSHKLGDLIRDFHLQTALDDLAAIHCPKGRDKYHCALYDALASALLLIHLQQQPGYDVVELSWLCSPQLAASQQHLF